MNAITCVRYEDWEIEIIHKGIKRAQLEVKDKVRDITSIVLNPIEYEILLNVDKKILDDLVNKMFDENNS